MKNSNYFSNLSVEEVLTNIKNDDSNAFVKINEELDSTEKLIAVKDIHSYKDKEVTFSSKVLQGYKAPFDSTVVSNLKNNGFNIVGITNMDEFAMGTTNKTSIYGGVKNALDPTKVSGGSSGGSAVAIAKGLIPMATGTDTGGSIRQPAAFNGIYALKPTYGLVSRYGTFALASSFDVIGPMSKTIEDNAMLLKAIASNDKKDHTNFMPEGYDPEKLIGKDVKGLKVAVFKTMMDYDFDQEIKDAVNAKVDKLKELGCEIVEIELPLLERSFDLYFILSYAEAATNNARYDGIKYGYQDKTKDQYFGARSAFGVEAKKRMIIGTYMITSSHAQKYYFKAMEIRKKMTDQFEELFKDVDIIITPTTPNLAFDGEEKIDPKSSYLSDLFAIPANLVGIPALNIPGGKAKDGSSIGVQIMANHYREDLIYQVAKQLEEDNE